MEDRDHKTELLVGLFLFIGLIMLGLLILQFGSVREAFKGAYSFTVALPDGTGIRNGTPVVLGGRKIGKASDKPMFNPTFTGVIIPLQVYRDVKIPSDARFSIGTSGLLGDAFIEVKPSGQKVTGYVAPNTEVKGEPAGGLGALQTTAKEVGQKVDVALEDIRGAVKDLRDVLKKLNEGAFSDSAMKDLKETFRHLNSVVTRLDENTFSDQTSTDIREAVSGLRNAARSLEEGVKKLDPAFEKIDSVAAKADKVMDSADTALKSVDKSATVLGETAGDLRKGEGLLPALLRDPELKDEFTVLITNLREHGVLFYRDSTRRKNRDTGTDRGASATRAASGSRGTDRSSPPRAPRPLTGTKP